MTLLSTVWMEKGEAKPLVRVSSLYSIQCFDTDDWVNGETYGLIIA